MLVVSVSALLLSVCMSYFGMSQTKNKAIISSKTLWDTAASDTKEALIDQAQSNISAIAKEKAEISNEKLNIICENIQLIANYMSDIYTNPGNYGERFVDIPRLENAGIAMMQFSHMNGVTYDMVITERDWYKFAVENKDVTLIETYYDAFPRLLFA